MSDSGRGEGNSHVASSRHLSCNLLMKQVIHLLPSLNQRGYKMLPNKDNGTNDDVGYPQPADTNDMGRSDNLPRTQGFGKGLKSLFNRST